MAQEEERDRQMHDPGDRLTRLSEASLRINESLDFDEVLQQVVDGARALTGARYGVITTMDDAGLPDDVFTSGITAEERVRLAGTSLRVYQYFAGLPEPLRVPDFLGHARSQGLSAPFPLPVGPFLLAPIRHRGEGVGNIYLAREKGGPEFSREDEETLVLFASQAALVIANARRHRDERRARADLEALVNTAPVGVLVFDALTGNPVSVNQEARRIIGDLHEPHRRAEELLDDLTVRRDDGREFSLKDLSVAQALSAAVTVRAEEIVLTAPDGRSVTALINATPIRGEDGEVETCVVTLQDMTPLEELERLRAEFLAMVSHELRTPLATVKGSIANLLDPAASLSRAEALQFFRIIDSQTDRMRSLISDLLDVARIETGTLSVSPEPTELAVLAGEAADAFRVGEHKPSLRIDLPPDLPWVMADRSRIVQVLGNLLSNAARHSPESSAILVTAVRQEFHVAVSVSDDGRGIAAESLPLLFRKFSRVEGEEQVGDTGLGLAVCKGIVEAHGGRIWADSDGTGRGASFTFTLPTAGARGYVSPAPPVRVSGRIARQREAGEQVRILSVDDDPQALRYIRDALVKAGFSVFATDDADDLPRLMEVEKPHVVLLDLMLQGADGIELTKEIRETSSTPVIFVSAYGRDQLIARALEAGGDDYVVKPFSPTELVARIRAVLRRRETPEPTVPYVFGDLTVDYAARLVTFAGSPVRLTSMEYRTLAELSTNAGRVVTYEHLLERVWEAEAGADLRPMRTVISTLRRSMGDDADNPTYIFTEPRVGYRMPKGAAPGPGDSTTSAEPRTS